MFCSCGKKMVETNEFIGERIVWKCFGCLSVKLVEMTEINNNELLEEGE